MTMNETPLQSLRRPVVIAATTSIATTTLLGVSIILLKLDSSFWYKVLTSAALVSLSSTGLLSCLSALPLNRMRFVSSTGMSLSLLALPPCLFLTWSSGSDTFEKLTYTAVLWAYVCAQVCLLFRIGQHDKPRWELWLTISASLSALTALLYTPVMWEVDFFANEFFSRVRWSLGCLAAAGGIILPAVARLMPASRNAPTGSPDQVSPIVLTTEQAAALRKRAADENLSENALLKRLLTEEVSH